MKTTFLALLLFVSTTLSWAESPNKNAVSAQMPADLRETFLVDPVFNGKTYFFEAGLEHPETVLLVHGIGDFASRIWSSHLAELAKSYHVVGFDLPGFGRSAKGNDLYSPQRYAEFLDWVIGNYSSGKVVLVGHSLGGALSLNYTAEHPDKVRHLVLIDAAGILHRTALTKNALHLEGPDTDEGAILGPVLGVLKKPIRVWNHVTGSTVENIELKNAEGGLQWIMDHDRSRSVFLGGNPTAIASLALAQENFADVIGKTVTPTSIIWGSEDGVSPLRTAKLLHGKLKNSRLRVLEHVGHVPILETPEAFYEILLEELHSPPTVTAVQLGVDTAQSLAVCHGQNDLTFTGNFDRIEVTDCQRIHLQDVHSQQIHIKNSSVEIENASVRSENAALLLEHAKVVGTNVLLKGEVAIHSSSSRLDLAGVELVGSTAAVQASDKTLILFSVSKASSPLGHSTLHGVVRLAPGESL